MTRETMEGHTAGKLTKAQRLVLECATGSLRGLVKGDFMGQYWRVIDALERRGLLAKTGIVHFKITAAGQRALCPDCKGTGRFDCEDERRSGVCRRCDAAGRALPDQAGERAAISAATPTEKTDAAGEAS